MRVIQRQWPYLKVDLERYHLDRAAILIVVGNPEEAQQDLKLLSFSQLKGRRSVYHLILQAQACFSLKEYAQAALLAEEALPLVRTMRSRVNLERIKTLYKQFQISSSEGPSHGDCGRAACGRRLRHLVDQTGLRQGLAERIGGGDRCWVSRNEGGYGPDC